MTFELSLRLDGIERSFHRIYRLFKFIYKKVTYIFLRWGKRRRQIQSNRDCDSSEKIRLRNIIIATSSTHFIPDQYK